jgi:lipopolysaccharide export LptBFGC system permease protein LptF
LKRAILLAALVCSFASFITLAWVMPASNQAFRVATAWTAGADQYPQRGVNELTMTDLAQRARMLRQEGETRQSLGLFFRYHQRWSLACATLVLAILGLLVVEGRPGMRLGTGLAACGLYVLLMRVGETSAGNGVVPVVVLAWLPNIVVLLVAMAVKARRVPAESV